MTKKAEDSRTISSQLWKTVYTRKEKSTGACSEFLENIGKKNVNLKYQIRESLASAGSIWEFSDSKQ